MKEPDLRFQAFRISKQAQVRTSTLGQIYSALNLAIYNHFDEDEAISDEMLEAIATLHAMIGPMVTPKAPSMDQIQELAKGLGLNLELPPGKGLKGPHR